MKSNFNTRQVKCYIIYFIDGFLYTILIVTVFAVSFAMAILSKIYPLCFRSAKKMLIMIDPRPVEEWCKDTPALMYAKYTLEFSYNYTAAVNKHIPRWDEDVFKWKFKRAENITKDIDG